MTSALGASVPKLSTPLSKSVSPTRYPQVPFCDLVVWTTSGTRVEIIRLDNTRTSYTLPTAAGHDLEDDMCVHYGMLGLPSTPETIGAEDFKVPEAGRTIPVCLVFDLNTLGAASFDDPAGILEEAKAVARYVTLSNDYYYLS